MEKERQIAIKDAYLQLIVDIAFDYDGYSKAEDLKNLIDELSHYAKLALDSNDKEPMYTSYSNGVETDSNILMETIEN